ncbi:polyprenyl synthetase family protein [Streptomyces sp. AV19]|uniref:polyprenyl synthetase family protein n=1 Tax=Streptomyces sp. AV19 TaxID=2793068 RepID=UPI0018FE105D|nr:polyprenyl synthetase family protein [Streptomyces sp. AV19]MBH1937561.1 polyprenyl synthetase family protein [Streptomyces sp. AV19]MDG4536433.1 polyprenyl synthetase family protein [Streptomyces sp. AV19]
MTPTAAAATEERLAAHRRRFDAAFEAYFARLAATFDTPPHSRWTPQCLELLRELSLRGGKRLRVVLLHEAARLVTAEDEVPGLAEAALSVELLQTHLLVHDDIIDDSPVRRGGPSTYYAYRAAFPGHDRTALGLALLAGDLAAFLSLRVLLEADVPAALRQAMVETQTRAATDTIAGQILDLERDRDGLPDEELLHTVTEYKSARYSILAPLRLGLLAAGEDLAPHEARLRRYATLVGICGQLRDDYLDLFGDDGALGKPPGGDLRAGRRTYALRAILAEAGEADRAVVESALGDPHCTPETVERVRDIARRQGTDARLRADLRGHAERAAAEAAGWGAWWREEAVALFTHLPLRVAKVSGRPRGTEGFRRLRGASGGPADRGTGR